MKFRIAVATLAVMSLIGCSSGSSDSGSSSGSTDNGSSSGSTDSGSSSGGGAGANTDLFAEGNNIPSADELPSNDMLAESDGQVSADEALLLVQGTWVHTFEDTQCAWTLQFNDKRQFTESSLDQRATGSYNIVNEGGLELIQNYETHNRQPDCFGDNGDDDVLDAGVSYGFDISFPDQNTMEASRGRLTFIRQ